MKKVRLTKSWEYDGQEFAAGKILEVDDDTAKMLTDEGYGTFEDNPAEVKEVGEPETKTQGDDGDGEQTIQITQKDYEKLVAKAAKAEKAARVTNRPQINVVKERIEDDGKRGYKDLGEFLITVRNAGCPDGVVDTRLKTLHAEKTVGSDEYAQVEDAIGGFLVPPTFSTEILRKPTEAEFIRANGARVLPVQGSSLSINAVSDTDRSSSMFGGLIAYFKAERAQMTATMGEFEQVELRPKTLTGMYFATDLLLNNAPAISSLIGSLFQQTIDYKLTDEFINGLGAGTPLGILNAPCTYSQAKETGQTAATIVTDNILNMRSHMPDWLYSDAVWIASLGCMPQLNTLSLDVGTGGAPIALINIGSDGITRLMGRPLIYSEFCQALGTVGDIYLASFPQYLIGETNYRRTDSSIHLRFDYNETAFRFVMQVDGQPWWRTTLTLKNSWEVAPFITLATRS